jgi:hypothetical protein
MHQGRVAKYGLRGVKVMYELHREEVRVLSTSFHLAQLRLRQLQIDEHQPNL